MIYESYLRKEFSHDHGEKITQRRLAAHLSQEILAERLGVSTQDVSRWESGEVLPDAEKLLQLCRVFGISADELLGENAKADDASDFLSLPLWRWSLRVISPPLAFAGTAAALTGLTGAVYHALTADQWYTDFGLLRHCSAQHLVRGRSLSGASPAGDSSGPAGI